jgi:hypothetical protein
MPPQSKFKVSSRFAPNMQRLADGIKDATEKAMAAAMEKAEQDAQQLYRWRTPGDYTEVDRGGNKWEWTVTGAAAASIRAYVVPNKRLKSLPGQSTTVYKNGVGFSPHDHSADPGLTGDYAEEPGKVKGVITMYVGYAPYLQKKEINGAVWDQPSPGNPVTIEVLDVYWDSYYVPHVIRPTIERLMAKVSASLR